MQSKKNEEVIAWTMAQFILETDNPSERIIRLVVKSVQNKYGTNCKAQY